jgi:hypothetical protein
MKTAGRENPNHGATLSHNRAHGAVGQNRSRSIRGAAKQEKFQPREVCFFLTSPFIELLRTWLASDSIKGINRGHAPWITNGILKMWRDRSTLRMETVCLVVRLKWKHAL